jgi:hypothetical protein
MDAKVNAILISEDMESLVQHGAPADEYLDEARKIVSAITLLGHEELTEERLTEIVYAVWSKSFGPFSVEEAEMRMPDFRQVARRILAQNA